ncbi:MAG: ankyrin repeat domain-containing protein [Candidatus Chromulinivorax sp.]|nr:ankyrin repeat domain-containing protein [Candidatus Chromulinivorax sp.]
MKNILKSMRYKSLIMIIAIGLSNYSQAIQPSQLNNEQVKQQDTILLPLHNIILNQNLTPQEKIQLMQDLLRDKDNHININAQDANGRTALNLAAFYKADPIIVQFLIVHKADVNEPDRFNESPLHNAIKNEEILIATMLLKAGAHQEFKNDEGLTPIDLARSPKTQTLFGFDS